MQSRLGIASFVIGIAVGVAYLVLQFVRVPTLEAAALESLWFLIGASVAGVLGLVLGILGWVRGQRAGRRTGFAIIGSALGLAITAWAVAAWIISFTQALPAQSA